jgi:hypothetical protein
MKKAELDGKPRKLFIFRFFPEKYEKKAKMVGNHEKGRIMMKKARIDGKSEKRMVSFFF